MILDSFKLDGKVALVTGASRGLGQAMALALAEAGADIAGLDLTSCSETCEQVQGLGRRFYSLVTDLRDVTPDQLTEVVARVVGGLGRLDILLNNAGIVRRAPVFEFSEEYWDDVLQINLKAVFFLSQAAARQMDAQGGGKIINIASMLSFQGGILVPSYTAAKSAVAGITKSMANELACKNINVNAIAPGYMATDNTAPLRADPKRNRAILERIPAGRWGLPVDLKGVAVFLASSASDYMHGAVVAVDGGWLCR
ncbi:MAG TPA: 2-dehydro-3-deoxy-D-gluconate 5-dehydrogenase KduD [Anaerolineales bacterium]|nr:2-dehydro-3-deoxy-D-gluconate 5-dehydrogenase KduD [Anaerolineales bacterium]